MAISKSKHLILLFSSLLMMGRQAHAQDMARPEISADGIVHVPAFDLPPSNLASKEASDLLRSRGAKNSGGVIPKPDIVAARKQMETLLSPFVSLMRSAYPADVTESVIGGVGVRIFTPKGVDADPDRVLINLHGGAYSVCEDACSFLESLPITALGKFKVVSVKYRMGPEALFPAASEDVVSVYKELLKQYASSQIGIYGCSAGGSLAAQAIASFDRYKLPMPGAIGIFGSGAAVGGYGDSAYLAAYIDGVSQPPLAEDSMPPTPPYRSYFDGVDTNDVMVAPMRHPEMLAKFPPTLLITGTRAADLSFRGVYPFRNCARAGVDASLIVGEGVGHCYLYMAHLPETRDAFDEIVKFFGDHLE